MTTKNRSVVSSLIVLVLILGPAVVFGQTTTQATSTTSGGPFKDIRREYRDKVREVRETYRDDRREIKDEIKDVRRESRDDLRQATSSEERESLRDDRREKIAELRQDKIKAHTRKIIARLTAALERSERFISRIESLLDQRAANNGQPISDPGAVTAKLTEAKNLITEAKTKVNGLLAQVENIIADDTPLDDYPAIRDVVTMTVQSVKDVHAKIVEAIRLIKSN